jgi:hypothetical protein
MLSRSKLKTNLRTKATGSIQWSRLLKLTASQPHDRSAAKSREQATAGFKARWMK